MVEGIKRITSIDTGAVVTVDASGQVKETEASAGLEAAQRLGLTRPVVFQEFSPEGYERPMDVEVQAHKAGVLPLEQMTPAYAYAMTWNDLKAERSGVRTFKDEMRLAKVWKEKLGALEDAFDLPAGHMTVDTEGEVLHVHPVEKSGETLNQSGHPLHFEASQNSDRYNVQVGRGFEAILPTHIQNSGYGTPAHPEMDQNVSAKDAIPSIKVGKYVRFGGAFNPQGNQQWVFEDNCWLGQGCYFISQEHPADIPAPLARSRQYTNFPGMHVRSWAWIAKQAQVLYRTQYIGEGAVVGSHAKVNNWVGDYSLVTSDGHQTFYPIKSFVINTLGVRDLKDMLAIDWRKAEHLWQETYTEWRKQEHMADANIIQALNLVRETPRSRVLFLGSRNVANIIHAATPQNGNALRRIDVMSVDQSEQAYAMQALNGMHNLNTRFRKVESLTEIPLGQFYEEPAYDAVVIEASAEACTNGATELRKIYDEARRLVKPHGLLVGTLHDVSKYGPLMTMPEYISTDDLSRREGDSLAIHVQTVLNNGNH